MTNKVTYWAKPSEKTKQEVFDKLNTDHPGAHELRLRKLRRLINEAEADGPSNYEPMSPALVIVNRLLKQRDDLAHLCGQILATLRLPQNAEETIGGDAMKGLVDSWRARYEACSYNPAWQPQKQID